MEKHLWGRDGHRQEDLEYIWENLKAAEGKYELDKMQQLTYGSLTITLVILKTPRESSDRKRKQNYSKVSIEKSIAPVYLGFFFPPGFPPGKYTGKEKLKLQCLPWERQRYKLTMVRIRNVFNQRMMISEAVGDGSV